MIKIAYTGDLHGHTKTPKNRSDDYFDAFCTKFSFFIDKCLDEAVDYIILAGDITDHHTVTYKVTNFLLKELRRWESFAGGRRVLTITGQHDVKYHSTFDGTPYESLMNSGLIQHLGSEPFPVVDFREENGMEVHFYGASFGEEIPEIKNPDVFNILAVHDMIVDAKNEFWEEKFKLASIVLKTHKYNLIVAGDNHKPFITNYRSRRLVMCGSMMRKNIDQKDYKPKFYVTYLPNNTHEEIYFPIEPDVFKEEEVAIGKERKILVEKFAESLKGSNLIGLHFSDRIKDAVKTSEMEEHVVETINDIMETVYDRSSKKA
jgi:DNA repair exonuclease SbcCD nuclease subunit